MKEKKESKRSVISTIGNILGKIILLTIVIFTVTILIRVTVFHKYDIFGYRSYLIVSGSMEPTIKINDAIIVKEADSYQKGDVIAYKYGANSVFAHRIIEVYTEEGNTVLYKTQGDFNNVADSELVHPSQVQGKLAVIIPRVGYVVNYLKNNFILIAALILIVAAIIIVGRLIVNERRRKKQE